MKYLVSFTIDNLTYARLSDSIVDAVTTMREANINHNEQFYRDAILQNRVRMETRKSLDSKASSVYSSRITSNIVLSILA